MKYVKCVKAPIYLRAPEFKLIVGKIYKVENEDWDNHYYICGRHYHINWFIDITREEKLKRILGK